MAALTILAIASLVAAAAGAGVAVHNSQQAAREAKDAKRDQNYQIGQLRAGEDARNAQESAEEDAILARARQRAVASMSSASNYGGTLKTSPLGTSAPPIVSQKGLLGL